jgi:hypothetical protein
LAQISTKSKFAATMTAIAQAKATIASAIAIPAYAKAMTA